jgi:hypothetical protein
MFHFKDDTRSQLHPVKPTRQVLDRQAQYDDAEHDDAVADRK